MIYIALYIDDNNDRTMCVGYLERYTQKCDNDQKRSPNDDIQNKRPEQIACFLNHLTLMTLKQNLKNYFGGQFYFVLEIMLENQFSGLNFHVPTVQISI